MTSRQLKDGSWPTRDDADDDYFKYHAAMCSISALYPRRFRGYGPCEVKLLKILSNMKYATRDGIAREGKTEGKAGEDMAIDVADYVLKKTSSGVASEEFKALKGLYEAQAVQSISPELPASAEAYSFSRLKEIMLRRKGGSTEGGLAAGGVPLPADGKTSKSSRVKGRKKALGSDPVATGGRLRRKRKRAVKKDREELSWRPRQWAESIPSAF